MSTSTSTLPPSALMAAMAHGESLLFKDIECALRTPADSLLVGKLTATTARIWFVASNPSNIPLSMRHMPSTYYRAPIPSIRRVEKSVLRARDGSVRVNVDIHFKDVRLWAIAMDADATAEKLTQHLRMATFGLPVEYLPAMCSAPPAHAPPGSPPTILPGWDVYNPAAELERLGVLSARHPVTRQALWRVTEVNRLYGFCPTYPATLVLPAVFPDESLTPLSSFRSKARLPALTWVHPTHRATMWRSSQPRVGMANNTCREDEALLSAIRDANVYSRFPAQPLLIADCRPRANAMGNKASGWGYESYSFAQLEFLGIHNIHAVRDSFKRMEALVLNGMGGTSAAAAGAAAGGSSSTAGPSGASAPTSTFGSAGSVHWDTALSDAGWLGHVRAILAGSLFVAECIHRRGQSVLVHCSDGWDRTAQICGLVQVLLDPIARTLRGFCALIDKEWCTFGHKFHQRAAHSLEKNDEGDASPVFIQFLDAVHQLIT
ncbi:hypothetical protein EON62_03100, partial [archaeon]